jgi:SulP family sulfate permease
MHPVNGTTSTLKSAENALGKTAFWTAVTAGVVAGLRTVLGGTAIAALILPADSPEFGRLLNCILLSGAAVGVLITWLSAYRNVIAQPQDGPAVLIGVFAVIVAGNSSGIPFDRAGIVVLGAIALSSVLTGCVFFVLGRWQFARFVRFIPYPVIGGFLAGSGLLIILIALNVLAGQRILGASWADLSSTGRLPMLLAGIVYAAALYIILRRVRHFLTLPVLLLGTALLFHLAIQLRGIPLDELRLMGWLMQPTTNSSTTFSPGWLSLSAAEWVFLAQNILTFGAIALVSTVAFLLNLSSLEVAARTELDFNRELKITGLANIVGGLLGGIVSFHALSASLLGRQMGVESRGVGITAGLFAIAIVAFGHGAISYIPVPLLGALLLCIGYGLLHEWLFAVKARFSAMEYVTVLTITLLMAAAGYLVGVGAGILLSTAFFVWRYSHLKVITQEISGSDFHSNVERPAEDMRQLEQHGGQIRILKVEGFLFFGTAFTMLDRIQALVNDGVRYFILDMSQVKAADSSALSVFSRIALLCESNSAALYFARTDSLLQDTLLRHSRSEGLSLIFFEDRDFAIEYSENLLLEQKNSLRRASDQAHFVFRSRTWDRIASHLSGPDDLTKLQGYFELRDIPQGEYLMRQGEESAEMFFIESGRIQVLLKTEDRREVRLRSMTAGTLLGEVGFYVGERRTASAFVESSARVFALTRQKLAEMERDDGKLAQALNSAVIRLLSERLAATNRLIQRLDP